MGILPPYILGLLTGIASGAAMLPYPVIKAANPASASGTATGVFNFQLHRRTMKNKTGTGKYEKLVQRCRKLAPITWRPAARKCEIGQGVQIV